MRESVLSNTATPYYYGLFRDAVTRGEIPVCEEISQEMNRIDALIADPRYYYDVNAVKGFILFCENEMTLTDGTPVVLLDTFKLWAEQIFCWYYFVDRQVFNQAEKRWETKTVKKRLTTKQYLIVARGAAKSLYETFLQAFFLVVDTSTTKQITTAPTMRLAEEILGPFQTAITVARGPVFKFLTQGSLQNTTGNRMLRQKLVSTKRGIENFLTNSVLEIRPMTINKLQSLRTKCNTVDEWLSGDLREDVVSAIEQGASKVPDYLIVCVSSEGTVRNGAGDTIKMELASILHGDYYAPHVSIWHYKLDDISEVGKPEMWLKAQPNLDKTVTSEVYHLDVERAEQSISARNDIVAKRFGIPMEGYSFFFTYEDTLPHRRANFWRLPCALGADLSLGDDFCAFTFLFPLAYEKFGVKGRSYVSRLTFDRLPGAKRLKYEQFIEEGSLVVMDGSILDVSGAVYDDLEDFIEKSQYDVRAFGYDPYNAKEFVTRWEELHGGSWFTEKVIQGAKTESVPLGELKKLASDRRLIFDQEIISWTMGNSMAKEDLNGNRMLIKQRRDEKVDNVSAMMDALVAYKLYKENFE